MMFVMFFLEGKCNIIFLNQKFVFGIFFRKKQEYAIVGQFLLIFITTNNFSALLNV